MCSDTDLQVLPMSGRSPLSTTEAQRAELQALASSRDRGEADRARAVLLTVAGWTSPQIGEAFGVREDTGAALAQRLHERRCRGAEGHHGTWPFAGEE